MTNFNESAWVGRCDDLADKARVGAGLSFEMYQRRLSSAIEAYLRGLPAEHQAQAVCIAREKYNYLTPQEVETAKLEDKKNGYCTHGFAFDCCPLGCGDL